MFDYSTILMRIEQNTKKLSNKCLNNDYERICSATYGNPQRPNASRNVGSKQRSTTNRK